MFVVCTCFNFLSVKVSLNVLNDQRKLWHLKEERKNKTRWKEGSKEVKIKYLMGQL